MSTQRVRTRNETTATSTPGAELRNYRLHERIGQEELATVYAATHLTLDRPVEVHILRRTDWVSASRFQLAAKLAARLSHPNLLPVIDAGHDEHYGDYLVTPTLQARPLNEVLQEEPLEPLLALRVCTQVAAALDYLHQQQIVHRDVQPENILLTSEGIAYLTNLGLAAGPDTPDLSSVDEADYLTHYSAPEQRLDQGEAVPALDIYSLGAVLYHMLSGNLPPVPEPAMRVPSLAEVGLAEVDEVIRQMMAYQPEMRPASAGAAATALRHALRDQIDQSTDDMQESRWEPVAEWLENPLETVLSTVLEPDEGRQRFEDYMLKSRARADALHRADTIRRILNRWSRKGFFRRPALGRVLQLEQIVSYNVYFYGMRTLYETRSAPRPRQRPQEDADRRSTLAPPPVWEASVPESGPFADVPEQELVLPNSTQVFTCSTCEGTAKVTCRACSGSGMVDRTRKVRNPDGTTSQEVLSEKCPTCHGYGKETCASCTGLGNLVEEAVFVGSRRARLWQNTDEIEDLPRMVLRKHTRPVCETPIDPYRGIWHSVAPLDELLRSAVKDVQDDNTRIIAADLSIEGVPVTEIDYKLDENGKPQRLYLVGADSEIVGDWSLLNPERIALIGIVALVVVVVVIGLLWWLL